MKKWLARISLMGIFIIVSVLFAGVAYMIYRQQRPEYFITQELVNNPPLSRPLNRSFNQKVSQEIDQNLDQGPSEKNSSQNTTAILKAYFSPDDNVRAKLIDLIDNEQESLSIAIYTLTDKDITNALLQAYERGVGIEIVSDRAYSGERYSRIPILANHRISIWVYQTPEEYRSLMHNKFIIFKKNILDKSIVWTGSFNFTKSASISNQENVIVTDNPEVVSRFEHQFKLLKQRSLLISGTSDTDKVAYDYRKPSDASSVDWLELLSWILKGKWKRYIKYITS